MSLKKAFLNLFRKEKPKKRKHKVTVRKRYDKLPTIKGKYENNHLKIKGLIRKILADYDFDACYIGATENLDSRWSKYSHWTLRHVIYETTSYKFAKKAEENLIRYAGNLNLGCNKHEKSLGLVDGAEKYYIYMLSDHGCQLRP